MSRRSTIRTSTEEWRAIAKGPNLLYHICSTPSKQEHGWSEEDFYASGRQEWAQFLSHWQHYAPDVGGACVEIGCGAGRLTSALVGHFDSVTAVDVSGDMIARARQAAGDAVVFHQVDGSKIPVAAQSVDAVFTVHVLQHLDDQAAIQAYVDEAFRVLRPGGTIMAHIMLAMTLSWPEKVLREARLARSRFGLSQGKEHTAVRMVFPTVGEAVSMLRSAGFLDVEIQGFDAAFTGGMLTFFLGRKPG